MNNYIQLATIRPMVLSSSAYRHAGTAVFTEGRRTSVTLVSTPDHRYLFKLGNKVPLFTAENQPDGTVKLTSTHVDFPCWLTVDSGEIIRLAKKAGLDIDELFLHEETVTDTFKVPTSSDSADLADFASQHLDFVDTCPTHHQVPAIVPCQQNRGQRAPKTRQRISNKYKQRITRKEPQRGSRFPTPAASSYTSEQFEQDVALLWG